MDASPVFGLGYVRIWEADLTQWQQFAEGVLGMLGERDGDSRLLVRMDDWVGRFIVEEGQASIAEDGGSLVTNVAIGWECTSEEAWASARRSIDDAGVRTEDGTGPTAWCRDWFACTDPSGFRCEFFYGGKRDPASQFVSPRGVSFITGEQGMGHVLVRADAIAKSLDFYSRVLGFQVREAKSADDGTLRAVFLSPNQREHSLAMIGTQEASALGHVLIEVSDFDAVGRAMDRCLDGLAPMTVSLGRHWNDEMVSFYLRTPAGFDIEYGFGGRKVAPERWSRGEAGGTGLMSSWGHRRVGPDGRLGLQLGR
jgi:3,4-dihydroxy-9,10-secoandrosta-1,3,5(10)-triene-9,17-dione 4,5-dioxygenase